MEETKFFREERNFKNYLNYETMNNWTMTTDFALIKISYLTKFGRFVQQIYFLNLEHLSSRIIKTDGPDNFKVLNYQKHSFNGALWNGCSPVNLLYIFRIPFPKNTSGRMLLNDGNVKSETEQKKAVSRYMPNWQGKLVNWGNEKATNDNVNRQFTQLRWRISATVFRT